VAADGLVPVPAVLLAPRPLLQQHLAAAVEDERVDRAHRDARRFRLRPRARADDVALAVVQVEELFFGY
jgi:hypothetical protein